MGSSYESFNPITLMTHLQLPMLTVNFCENGCPGLIAQYRLIIRITLSTQRSNNMLITMVCKWVSGTTANTVARVVIITGILPTKRLKSVTGWQKPVHARVL